MSYSMMTLLPDRALVEVRGPDAAKFLQDLVTNDIERAEPGGAIFAGLLTPQGKILCDFLIYIHDPQTYWIDIASDRAADFAKRLAMYKLRAKVEISDRSGELAIGAARGDRADEMSPPGILGIFADPRYAPLGERFVIERARPEAGRPATAFAEDAAYHAHRIALAVPRGGLDYAFGETFPHEACYDDLHGVDFKKGCYIGQEVVSRMHHRGTAKTRIVAVEASAEVGGAGAEILAGDTPVGRLGSMDGTRGVALVRLDRIADAIGRGVPLRVGDVALTVSRPPWASFDVPTGESGS